MCTRAPSHSISRERPNRLSSTFVDSQGTVIWVRLSLHGMTALRTCARGGQIALSLRLAICGRLSFGVLRRVCGRFAGGLRGLLAVCGRFAGGLQAVCGRFVGSLRAVCEWFAVDGLRAVCVRIAVVGLRFAVVGLRLRLTKYTPLDRRSKTPLPTRSICAARNAGHLVLID